MARGDVYRLPGQNGGGLVLDVQADLLSSLTTRVVIPLFPPAAMRPAAARLNPVFTIERQPYMLMTQAIATVPRRALGQVMTSLKNQYDTVLAAIDLLLTGL